MDLSSLSTTAPQDIGLQDAASFEVYRQLKEDIVSCELKPNTKLRFDGLRKTYGVGIGTLREALSHLLSDGLVRTEVGRGFRVAPVSIKDLNDVTNWRVEFEVRAVTESMRKGDELWEANVISAHHLLSKTGLPQPDEPYETWIEYRKKHEHFHNTLVASCDSPWLLYFRNVLWGQARRYQALSVHVVHSGNSSAFRTDHDHSEIMNAAISRDEKAISEMMEDHIRHTANIVKEGLDDFMEGISTDFVSLKSRKKNT